MFWRVAGLATASPVDGILDKDSYTLEELLDEDDLIQECKSLNNRLITFLRAKEQVQKMVRYVVEPPPDGSDDKRNYKFPFISCEVFTCEIDQILNTIVEEPEILDLLFTFPRPDRPHSNLLSGYFSKVVNSLLLRKTPEIMAYLQAHQDILKQLVDLVGTTSVMEVIMRLVGAHDEILMYHSEKLEWLADTPLLDLLVEQLGPKQSPDVQANAAEVLSAIARTNPAALSLKLATPTYVHKLFHHVLEEPRSMSSVINSLSVCITLLSPRRLNAGPGAIQGFRAGQPPMQQPPLGQEGSQSDPAMVQTIGGMLERLGAILELLDTSKDDKVLPTTYGQLCPPLGIHRLKIVEFLGVLLSSQSDQVFTELIRLGGIKICLDLFFRYHFNNFLHHNVERMVMTILESGNGVILEQLLVDCDLLNRILLTFEEPHAPDSRPEPRVEEIRGPTRSGYMGHITRIANRIAQLCNTNSTVDSIVSKNTKWVEWQRTGLKAKNQLENVYKWACGRPASLDDRPQDSDDDDFNPARTDFDISTISLASNAQSSFQQPRYGQPMLDTSEDEGPESSTTAFDTQMAEQGMTELRIDDSPSGTSVEGQGEASSADSTQAAAEGLVSLMDDAKPPNPPSLTEPMDASESLFTSTDAGRTAWIAFQDEQQQQHNAETAAATEPERTAGLDITPNPSPLSTSYTPSPRPVVTVVDSFSQTVVAVEHPIVEVTAAAGSSPGTTGPGTAADAAPVIDLFANAPPEFRVHPQLIQEGVAGSAPPPGAASSSEGEGPVAMDTDSPVQHLAAADASTGSAATGTPAGSVTDDSAAGTSQGAVGQPDAPGPADVPDVKKVGGAPENEQKNDRP